MDKRVLTQLADNKYFVNGEPVPPGGDFNSALVFRLSRFWMPDDGIAGEKSVDQASCFGKA
jgi:hypothetical protein